MDESLLATKGIKPSEVNLGFVDGYGLRIGERATVAAAETVPRSEPATVAARPKLRAA